MSSNASLLCSAGVVRDDVEEQTLTYLLLRPLPRSALYAIKLLASMALFYVVFAAWVIIRRLA